MYKLNDAEMVYDMADGRAVVINFVSGSYYGTGNLGSEILDRILKGYATDKILAALKAIPGCPADIDGIFDSFVNELIEKNIIVAGETVDGGDEPFEETTGKEGFALNVVENALMMKSGRKVSVVIPAYNAAGYLDEAVMSVYRQNWLGEVELIIVDNNSTDATCEVASKYNCVLLHEEHKGAAFARNRGIAEATGDFVVLLDADDRLTDGAADALFKPMYGAKPSDVVFARAVDFISPELTAEESARLAPRAEAYSGVLPGCSVIRRSVFDRVGLFDTSFSSGETIDWMIRLKEQGIPTVSIEEVVLMRRLHMTNTGRMFAQDEKKNYAAILRKRMMKK